MWRLDDDRAYRAWREMRLADTEGGAAAEFVTVSDLANPRETELAALRARCARFNLVLYRSERQPGDDRGLRAALRSLAGRLGLRIAERHRSAGAQGIVALTFSDAPRQRGYIPYSRRGMNWHTDGYYNDAASRIRAFLLHCARPAARGGENRLLDPEIAYIRLRDENPAHVAALMHPQAMTIPENREEGGRLRPASVGPVFSTDPMTGRLVMRYTARTRSIAWREDPAVRAAADCLREILSRPDAAMISVRLKAGEGVLNNNVLHDRTAFEDDGAGRLVYRVRFHNRVDEGETWPS